MGMLIRIITEKCPYCGSNEGKCSVEVDELYSLERIGVKTDEKKYFQEFFGLRNTREAYLVQSVVCNNSRAKRE